MGGLGGLPVRVRVLVGSCRRRGRPAAGRFEFQLMKDFRPGGTPKLVYANRRICMSCHQNGGPLFSRPTWDETNANPKVAALLDAPSREFLGVAANRGVDVPNAIDDA